MDLLLEETWGTGYFQKRSLFINTVIILPLQGLYFHNLFFGQELDHACDENNKILEQYSFDFNSSSSRIARNSSDSCAQECSMESSYANEFNFLCEDAAHRTTILRIRAHKI
ncbi:Oidioi.mRNA.OKI2018_I69.XSR.g16796.t1.cds [Oikopleura dioica]|uniref:Oidioi.mRNA.OKI2018_I69.XSR.g16796.t1.cds n=1 Tax=Oikopleura dioica TaxID=34765 RepID=A0ABN7SPI7_OIKDI|nr:Oidioi.mRNA.OKI2018_I69.XSR.g16796.t1.cds [Oikopleura dioica]